MSNGMTNFWEWMEKKGYAIIYPYDLEATVITSAKDLQGRIRQCLPTPQMLEGYMREFIFDVLKAKLVSITEWVVYPNGQRKQIYAGPFELQKVIEEAFK